jgi:hypothetical protein
VIPSKFFIATNGLGLRLGVYTGVHKNIFSLFWQSFYHHHFLPNLRLKWLGRTLLDLDAAEANIAKNNPQAAAGVVLKTSMQHSIQSPSLLPRTR